MKRSLRWTSLCLAITAVLLLQLSATADVVSGRLFGPDEKPIVLETFTAKDTKGRSATFKTNKDGNFTVYLDPGLFTVTYAADATVEGTIESYPQPKQQDIHLKKKGK